MHGTASHRKRERGAKMTVRVYTVTREGTVSPPRAAVSVPRDYVPEPQRMNTRFADCDCPIHRQAGGIR